MTIFGITAGTTNPTIRWGFYVVELAIYFAICYSLALLAQWQERRAARVAAIA